MLPLRRLTQFVGRQPQHFLRPARLCPAQPLQNSDSVPTRWVRRNYSSAPSAPVQPPDYLSEAELRIFNKLKSALEPIKLEVQDISGGCGSMYGVDVVSPKFDGLPVIKQHQLVNKVLAEDIKGWHGMQLKTKAPSP